MALTGERLAALAAYCRLDETDGEMVSQLEGMHATAVGYMTAAGISEPPDGTPRRAQYDLCVNALVLDNWDNRGAQTGKPLSENPVFRRMLNQLKWTEGLA